MVKFSFLLFLTLNMLFYTLSIYAQRYIVFMDKNQCPLHSTENFKTATERLMYDGIFNFYDQAKQQKSLFFLIEKILSYIKYQKNVHKLNTTIAEIKYLFACYITAMFNIVDFQYDLLVIESAFDDELVSHCVTLCQYDNKTILNAVEKHFKHHNLCQYYIFRSYSYIKMAFCTYLYEVYRLKVKQNIHNRHEFFYAREFLNIMGYDQTIDPSWIYNDENELEIRHYVFADILTYRLDITELEKWKQENYNRSVNVDLLYSDTELMEALENNRKKRKKLKMVKTANDIKNVFKNVQNLVTIADFVNKAKSSLTVGPITFHHRHLSLYEKYGRPNKVDRKHTVKKLNRRAFKLMANVAASRIIFEIWIEDVASRIKKRANANK